MDNHTEIQLLEVQQAPEGLIFFFLLQNLYKQ